MLRVIDILIKLQSDTQIILKVASKDPLMCEVYGVEFTVKHIITECLMYTDSRIKHHIPITIPVKWRLQQQHHQLLKGNSFIKPNLSLN